MTWHWYAACILVVLVCGWMAWAARKTDTREPTEDGDYE